MEYRRCRARRTIAVLCSCSTLETLDTFNIEQEESIFNEGSKAAALVDDVTFQRTKEYTTITDLLRLLYNSLVKLIESWENFANGEIQYFDVTEFPALEKKWDSYKASINQDMSELRYLRRTLMQRIEMFDNKRSGVSFPSQIATSGLRRLR